MSEKPKAIDISGPIPSEVYVRWNRTTDDAESLEMLRDAYAALADLRKVAEGVSAQLKVADQCITMLRSELGSLIRKDMAMASAGCATQKGNGIAFAAYADWKKANP